MMIGRVDDEIKKLLNDIFVHELNDPRIDGMVSVTRVLTAKDLKTAKVYVSIFNSQNIKEAFKAVSGSAGHLKSLLFRRMRIRHVPTMTFYLDEGMEYSVKIGKLLKELNIQPEIIEENLSEDE